MKAARHLRTASRSVRHPLLARVTHDELAREKFVLSFKLHIGRQVQPANRMVFEKSVAPRFARKHGRTPSTPDDIAGPMAREPLHQMWSALSVTGQELMWRAVGTSLERDLGRITVEARRLRTSNAKRGSLMLDAEVRLPAYAGVIDIHGQPGGYELDESGDDVLAGALYEAGGNLYSRGAAIGREDSKAGCLIAFLQERYPDLDPKRIVDLGCSAGAASVPYAEAYGRAEVHGIDIGGGMLRYAHARAEALGMAVHFSQQNCGEMRFEDASFDLVVSHNLFHEISGATASATFRECHRVLRPGGVMMHLDIPVQNHRLDLADRFVALWQTRNNAEPCFPPFAAMGARSGMARAGFAEDEIVVTDRRKVDGRGVWYVFGARKS
jgi:2-polyprenyl-3-methyl-5-hydroxy-6-metoxy-1,4-benzoquinol methylase